MLRVLLGLGAVVDVAERPVQSSGHRQGTAVAPIEHQTHQPRHSSHGAAGHHLRAAVTGSVLSALFSGLCFGGPSDGSQIGPRRLAKHATTTGFAFRAACCGCYMAQRLGHDV